MGLLSSIFGDGGGSDRDSALMAVKNVPLPVLKEYYPELYQQVVSLNPELETAVDLGPSEMAGIATDPTLRQAQLNALSKLQEVGEAGGRDSQFLADQSRLESDINTQLQGQQGAIMQNMAARGMSGGMSEMVARNMAAQGASNQYAQTAMDAKAQADKRALEAIMNSGTLGGQMQAQDFAQQSAKAQAGDAIKKFNAQNQQQVISNNVNTKNNAQQWNAQQAQNTANSNTDTRNSGQQYNLGLAQQNFNNQMAKATGVANQYNNIASGKDAERSGEMQLVGNLIGAGANAYAGGKK
ncbi:hypothetical protein [Bdellovibrio sp. HCB288]|uniref:hypothetical protein n=1 Tax=Bdellovibrio sp. HCB288 TaxID=3394355 RepID=UPI0039B4BC45